MKHLLAVLVLFCSTAALAAAAPPAGKATAAPVAAAVVDSFALLEQAVAKDSTHIDNLYRLGVMYLDRDRPTEAVIVLGKVYEKQPKNLRLLVNLGAAHDALNHADIAQGLYRQALEVSPQDSVATCRLASSLYTRGKHQEAMDLLRSVIQRTPGAYCAYFTLGVAFADAGIYRDAIRMWQKVVELAPTSPEGLSAQESITVLQKFVQ